MMFVWTLESVVRLGMVSLTVLFFLVLGAVIFVNKIVKKIRKLRQSPRETRDD
jgi:large-conductance mechanosensitive channel